MPKRRTARQRETQRRAHEAEQRLARDEREREEHVRLVAERSGDPRFVQRMPLPEGGPALNWSLDTAEGRAMQEAFEANLQAFREKFGRDPGPDDPVFFDPDADEPTPLGPQGWQSTFEALRQAAEDAGVDPAYVAAWQEVGHVVTDENRHLFSAAEVQAYVDAVERHQQPTLPEIPLPADLFAVELTVNHRRAWSVEPGEELETWNVSADVYDEAGNATVHVGDMRFVAVDLDESADASGLLADEDGNLPRIARVIFDRGSGELAEDLDESLEPVGSRILVVDLVRLEPAWRGFGIGALLTASAIKILSGGVRAVICYPAPLPVDEPGAPAAGAGPQRKQAIQALGTVASRIGFGPFRDGVWALDLSLVTFEECLEGLRAEARRYERG
ncbi:MAG: hypothetical protein JXA67_03930 [Micromonosporaceae bacterium]|nr:hypothetical protein [Micromonosporaceae bacterium]